MTTSALNSGRHSVRVGEFRVTALSDGLIRGNFGLVAGIDADDARRQELSAGRSEPPLINVNAFLIERGDAAILVDTGCGESYGPDLGRIEGHLAALGVRPEAVGTVLLTHLHGDHANGLLTADKQSRFPNATLVMHEAEPAFWRDDALVAAAPPRAVAAVTTARAVLDLHRDRLEFAVEGEVLPGLHLVAEPGHTPGHCGWLVESGGEQLLIWGDIVHLPGIQFARPEAGMIFDIDRDSAEATRRRLFDRAAADRLLVAGMHLDFPAFGVVERLAGGAGPDGYRFELT
ncbi:glyoxylase-like metal-dependent hydrolase (beta-lactamase superfamily II) [Azospirillum agricola]|uniref:MBL fold metallo-hydrolase n=1 Tax=Azospirillum agricola TaxID=1720247 RepID=UPI001AE6D392|nr:MBL fold metallo-hydrolase [Azospirillum agricola]MBP2227888.1 glyoxylase-like metal-dependent hydrolase (beta-lactamase superfamily II) [Azospirillum agricola]